MDIQNNNNKEGLSPLSERELFLLRTLHPEWFLWELNALHPVEIKEFTEIVTYLKENKTLTIPTKYLLKLNIHPMRSSLLTKLVKKRRVYLSANEMTFKYKSITQENLNNEIAKLNVFYTNLMEEESPNILPYPTSHFRMIHPDCIIKMNLEKIGLKNIAQNQYSGKVLEIIFPDHKYPPILITKQIYPFLQKIAIKKLIHHMKFLARENVDFFIQRIEVEKKRMSAQYPRLFEFDLAKLNKSSNNAYREEYTVIVLQKLFSNKNIAKMFLVNFDSEQNNHMARFFPSTEFSNFDLLQSFDYLKEIYLNSDINNAVQLESLNKMVFESTKLYLNLSEIRNNIFTSFPEIADEQYDHIIVRFFDEYVKKKGRTGFPQIYHLKITIDDQEEDVLIHHLNINRLINNSLEKLERLIPRSLTADWEDQIHKHKLAQSMFIPSDFSALILAYSFNEDPFIMKLIKDNNLYRILAPLDQLSRLTIRLKLYTHNEMDKVLNINREILYKDSITNILGQKSFWKKFFFIITNWIQKRNFIISPDQNETKKPVNNSNQLTDEDSSKKTFLTAIDIDSEGKLEKKCNQLWDLLPDSLNRNELEQNIKSDLYSFFKQRKEVPLFALKYIEDGNTNRIQKKAPHLSAYKKDLSEFIHYQILFTISKTSSLRKKVSLKII